MHKLITNLYNGDIEKITVDYDYTSSLSRALSTMTVELVDHS